MPGPFMPRQPAPAPWMEPIRRFAEGLLGPAPVIGTTIGPGAIPLDAEEEYLRKVAQTTLSDLDNAAGSPVKQMYTGVKNIVGRAFADPVIDQYSPNVEHPFTRESLHELINHLIEAYHPTYLGPGGTPR